MKFYYFDPWLVILIVSAMSAERSVTAGIEYHYKARKKSEKLRTVAMRLQPERMFEFLQKAGIFRNLKRIQSSLNKV